MIGKLIKFFGGCAHKWGKWKRVRLNWKRLASTEEAIVNEVDYVKYSEIIQHRECEVCGLFQIKKYL